MIFNEFKQNASIVMRLKKNIESSKVSHAYIFESPKNVNKLRFALGFVQEIFCKDLDADKRSVCETLIENGNHPDVLIISSPKTNSAIKDEEIFALQSKLNTSAMLAKQKVVIIDKANLLTPKAQNRILKTLEEPKVSSIIIFLADSSENLLQTIRSRCIAITLNEEPESPSEELMQIMNITRSLVVSLKNKEPFYRLMKNYEEFFSSREKAEAMLNEMQLLISKDFLVSAQNGQAKDMAKAMDLISRALQDLKIGVKASYAMKNLLIKLEDTI